MCNISIDFVTGVLGSDGALQEVIVVGQSEDCPLQQAFAPPAGDPLARVVVRLVHAPSGTTRTEHVYLGTEDAQAWAVSFKGVPAECDDEVRISAWCGEEESDCGVEGEAHTIVCGCPSVTFVDPIYADTCVGGQRDVTITAQWLDLPIQFPANTLWRYGPNNILPAAIFPGDTEVTAVLPISNADMAVSTTVIFELFPGCVFSVDLDAFTPCPSTDPCPANLVLRVKDAAGTPLDLDNCVEAASYIAEVTGENLDGADIAWSVDGEDHGSGTSTIITMEGADLEVTAEITRDGCAPEDLTVTLEACPPAAERECPSLEGLEVVADGGGPPLDTGECLPAGSYVVRAVGEHLDHGERAWTVDGQSPEDLDEAEVRADGSLALHLDRDRNVELRIDEPGCDVTPREIALTACKTVPPTDPRRPPPPWIDPCLAWFWLNVGLMVLTGIMIFITGCILDGVIQAGLAAAGSAGTGVGAAIGAFFGAIAGALGVLEIVMIIVCIALVLVTLGSFFLWIFLCLRGNWSVDKCAVLGWLIWILHALEVISGLAAAALAAVAIGSAGAAGLGCMLGAIVDFAWYSLLVAIAWAVAGGIGCALQEPDSGET